MFVQNLNSTHAIDNSSSPIDKLGSFWCTLMHDSLSWPMHGHYTCLTCGRQYVVRWDAEPGADLPVNAEDFSSTPSVPGDSNTSSTRLQ